MVTRYINLGRQIREKENWTTEDMIGRHFEVVSRKTVVKNSQKPVRMGYAYTSTRKRNISRNS